MLGIHNYLSSANHKIRLLFSQARYWIYLGSASKIDLQIILDTYDLLKESDNLSHSWSIV